MAVAAAVLLFLVQKLQFRALVQGWQAAEWPFVLFAGILVIPNIGIQACKWHALLKTEDRGIQFCTALKSILVGYPLGFVTPGRLGEMGRAFFLKKIGRRQALKLALVDKLSNFMVTVSAGLIGLFLLLDQWRLHVSAIFLILLILLFAPVLAGKFVKRTLKNWLRSLALDRRGFATLFAYAAGFYAIFTLQYICLICSFASVPLFPALGATSSAFLVKTLLPISLADLGIREGASILFLSKIGISAPVAFNAALMLFALNLVVPSILGLKYLFAQK